MKKNAITAEKLAKKIRHSLRDVEGIELAQATDYDVYCASARVLRGIMQRSNTKALHRLRRSKTKAVGYLSAEFLLGTQLRNALLNADLSIVFHEAMELLHINPAVIIAQDREPGLGNGGLGRLAACFVDSLATLGVPAFGYGIEYRYGIFKQVITEDGRQEETPDYWLAQSNPWRYEDFGRSVPVYFGGTLEHDELGKSVWKPSEVVKAVPVNYLIPGYKTSQVNTLRLWSAHSYDEFDLKAFNEGKYYDAVRPQVDAENITKILYPEDSTPQGKRLRLQQQYFFVSASLHDAIATLYAEDDIVDLHDFASRIVFQLNDTHPVIAIPECMRILIDEYGYDWDEAWEVTRHTFNYTCHTLLPEALEVWSIELIESLLPRHMEIIRQIDAVCYEEALRLGDDEQLAERVHIIDKEHNSVRMAYLATATGDYVNGVAQLHSQLLKDVTLHDFSLLYPQKFTNVTNGVTPRRFIKLANPRLSDLISDALGSERWLVDLEELQGLVPFAENLNFVRQFGAIKQANKREFAALLNARYGLQCNPNTMFNSMVKRLHEYKRQSLKILSVIAQYVAIKQGMLDPSTLVPRTVLFGAKAAPGYAMAKETIHLINNVAKVVNNDPQVNGALDVHFIPNYNVDLAEHLIPATELDEQISQAGKEASGTGNMKFALNGALTVGTLDGANVEIRECVGAENFFLFGLTVEEVEELERSGYQPARYIDNNALLAAAFEYIEQGVFSDGDTSMFSMFTSELKSSDRFMALADFQAYMDIQSTIDAAYREQDEWNRKAILNVARTGMFSSDRSIHDYLQRIWHTQSL